MKEDKTKRILLIGDGNHYFIRKLAEKLKQESSNIIVDCFSILTMHYSSKLPYDNLFEGSVEIPEIFNFKGGRRFCFYFKEKKKRKEIRKVIETYQYDAIHIHYATPWLFNWLKDFSNKLIVTVWGSDFYRSSKEDLKRMVPLFNKASILTFPSNKMSNDFSRVYHTETKHKIVRFGLEALDYIDKKSNQVKKDDDKINITIGYNRGVGQQHIKILEELKNLNPSFIDKIRFILPFTYGVKNEEYRSQIIKLLYNIGVDYLLYENFLTDEEVAKVRLNSDIMIQLQITDAFSGSMQEYMYANNILITGAWLPYNDLKEEGVYFEEVDQINNLAQKIEYVLANYEDLKIKCNSNAKLLHNLSSWDTNIKKWIGLYDQENL